jgi:uncharacterized protein YjiS (DUF1127 family)
VLFGGMTVTDRTWKSFKALLREWHLRRTSRRQIARLDQTTIRDLGFAESQLRFEAGKPFWRE